MANRDYKKIERTIRDFCMNVSGSGGIVPVKELPEVGEEGVVYETPDGKMWACKNTTETETICDLEVGKSFKLKDKILVGDIQNLSIDEGVIGIDFDEENFAILNFEKHTVKPSARYFINYDEGESTVEYECPPDSLPEDFIEPTLDGFTEIPSVTITQYFVNDLENKGFNLLDIAFVFKGGSHTETTATSTWTEIGVPSGQANIFFQWYDGARFDGISINDIVLKVNDEVVQLTEIMSEYDSQKSFTGISTETFGEITIEVNIEGRISAEYAYNFAFINKQTVAFTGNVGTISGSVPIIIYLSTRNLF